MKRFVLLFLILLFGTTALLYSEPPDWVPISGTQYSMVVFADIFLEYNPFTGTDTCNIAAAFGPGGENDCRSLGGWQPDYPPYWDGYWYFTIVSNSTSESISFKIYDALSDSVYACIQSLNFEDGTTIGNPYSPFELTTHPESADFHNNGQIHVLAYPNPFDQSIVFDLSFVKDKIISFTIYNIKGEIVNQLDVGNLSSMDAIVWTPDNSNKIPISTGLYFYKIETSNNTSTGKIVFLR